MRKNNIYALSHNHLYKFDTEKNNILLGHHNIESSFVQTTIIYHINYQDAISLA